MRRRQFIAALGGAAAWPLVARAQRRNEQVAHIAYLGMTSPSTLDPRQIEKFKQGLADNGLIEGRNITVDYFWAEGRPDRLRQLAPNLPNGTSTSSLLPGRRLYARCWRPEPKRQ